MAEVNNTYSGDWITYTFLSGKYVLFFPQEKVWRPSRQNTRVGVTSRRYFHCHHHVVCQDQLEDSQTTHRATHKGLPILFHRCDVWSHTYRRRKAARKAIKRRITSDDESDNTVSSQAETPNSKPVSKKPRISIVGDVEARLDTQSRSQSKSAAAIPRATGVGKKSLKRKQRIVSDDDDDEEEFVPEPEEKSAMVPMKHKQKDPKSKVKPGSAGGATNGKIIAKNESIITDPPALNAAVIGKKGVRKEEDDAMDVDVSSVPPAPAALRLPPMAEADPPKKKLPTIKKKSKKNVTANSTAVCSPAAPPKASLNVAKVNDTGSARPPPPAAAGPLKRPTAPVQATTMNPSGTGDFDLRDTNIWQSLIGKVSAWFLAEAAYSRMYREHRVPDLASALRRGSFIRVVPHGLTQFCYRISTEERRKQLDKMREEARARRDEQYVCSLNHSQLLRL